jgi:hypothetical protein
VRFRSTTTATARRYLRPYPLRPRRNRDTPRRSCGESRGARFRFVKTMFESGRRESNPHFLLGRQRLCH